ncbi:MAG: thioredoxin family protein [Candidatus Nanohaloarchaeota archaeon]|nr:thioredoxin family protein [Candidatus Nanohaloarchaeota archaeon]
MVGVVEFDKLKDLQSFVMEHEKVIVSVRPRGGCPICERYAPVFKESLPLIFEKFPDVRIAILWYGEDDECLKSLNVCSPTLIFYENGKEVDRVIVESVPVTEFKEKILEKIEKYFK